MKLKVNNNLYTTNVKAKAYSKGQYSLEKWIKLLLKESYGANRYHRYVSYVHKHVTKISNES